MTEEEYMRRVADLVAIRLPNPDAERQIRFMYSLDMPIGQAVDNLKRYLAIPMHC